MMKKILDDLSEIKVDRKTGKNKNHLCLLPVFFLSLMMTASCYHGPAIEGAPVSDLVKEGNFAVVRPQVMSKEKKEEVKRMTEVTENQVFSEISGRAEYRVGPLDVIEIISHIGEKTNTVSVRVNSQGNISYSFIDNLFVDGLTPTQLDALLTKRLSSYLRNPRIDIFVKEFKSKAAMVTGYLTSLQAPNYSKSATGKIFLRGKTTILDLIALAGGYTVDADIRRVKLVRGGDTYYVNLYDIISRGDSGQNIIIDADDVVDVPELPLFGDRVYVLGAVAQQGIYPLKQAQDLLGALALAGSFSNVAKEENTLIVRGRESGEEPLVMMADVNAILRKADISQNIPLQNGDLVFVPPRRIGDINRWIANVLPLLDIMLYPGDFAARYGEGWRIQVTNPPTL
jgi:protein involved in polysaccharide export with SLBB domain